MSAHTTNPTQAAPAARAATRTGARLLVLATSVLLVLALAELGLRHVFPLGGVLYRLNPEHLQEHIPGSAKLFVHQPANGSHFVRSRINSHGFRGAEPLAQRPGLRVMVYGDSFAMGEFSNIEDTLPAKLEQRLRAQRGADVEVINAGVVGAGPDQVSVRLPRELPRYRPHVVVLTIFSGNDFGDLIRNKLYRLDAQDRAVRAHPEPSPELIEQFSLSGLRSFALGRLAVKAWSSIPGRIAALRASREQGTGTAVPADFFEKQLELRTREFAEYGSIPDRVDNLFDDGYDADIALTPDAESARYKRALMAGVLREIARTTAENGGELFLVIIPEPQDLIDHYDGVEVDRARFSAYDASRLTSTLAEIAQSLAVPYVNLYGAFAAASPDSLYFKGGDNHWNEKGQALAAESTLEALEQQGVLQRATAR